MFRYFGPPGTGKTTALLNQVDSLLEEGVDPNRIGYFAFTRKAATEAKDRALARFHLNPESDLTFFRTLHSLAFQTLGLNSSQVLKERHLKEFGKIVGIDFSSIENSDDEGFSIIRSNHPIMRVIDLGATTLKGAEHAYNHAELAIPRHEFLHLFKEYERFKRHNFILDFTDMLVSLCDNPPLIPQLKVVFLDEAQDLTPLQWKLAHLLSKKCEKMFVAGDDDQGIYGWAGADIDRFISLEGASEVLSQSYRIPSRIWSIADKITRRIKWRQKKQWAPRPDEGTVNRLYDIEDLDFHGDWLILTQANFMLNETADQLRSRGYFYQRKGQTSLGKKVQGAISSWQHITSGANKEVSLKEAQNLYQHISSGKGIQRGAKKLLQTANSEDTFSLETLSKYFGLTAHGTWEDALDKIKDEDTAYIHALLNRGIDLNSKPNITLSTIHGAKGGEADNVLLYLDLTAKALVQMQENPDDAYRVLYVGVTRTKQNLYLKMPERADRGWIL